MTLGKLKLRPELLLFAFLCLSWVAVYTSTKLQFPPIADERKYYLPVIEHFSSTLDPGGNLMEAVRDYRITGGPLPYLTMAVWVRWFGMDLVGLRFISSLFAFGAIVFHFLSITEISKNGSAIFSLWRPSSRHGDSNLAAQAPADHGLRYVATLLLAFWPHFFVYSFTILNHSYALFFGLGGIYFFLLFLKSEKAVFIFASGLFLTGSVLCRQTYIIYPAVTGIWGLIWFIRTRKLPSLLIMISSLLPALALLFLVITWGGLVPPSYQSLIHVEFSPESFNVAFMTLAVYMFPTIFALRKHRKVLFSGLILAAVAYLANLWLKRSFFPLANTVGILAIFFQGLQTKSGLLVLILELGLMCSGAAILLLIFRPAGAAIRNFVLMLAAFSMASTLNTVPLIAEIYLVQAIPWLLILAIPLVPNKWLRAVWVISYMLAAGTFFYVRLFGSS